MFISLYNSLNSSELIVMVAFWALFSEFAGTSIISSVLLLSALRVIVTQVLLHDAVHDTFDSTLSVLLSPKASMFSLSTSLLFSLISI